MTSLLLAANVRTREMDRTGRRKTDAGAIETIRLSAAQPAGGTLDDDPDDESRAPPSIP